MSDILEFVRFQQVETNGLTLRAALAGEGPLVIMVHGWPESWYSWRHQFRPLVEAGYTACAIDVRGYGGSDKPHPAEAYAMAEITADVAGLVPALGHEQAILLGHDWGAPIVWNTALLHPERVRAVAGLSVPYLGAGPAPFIDIVKQIYTANGRFFYQVYFQDEGVAEAEFEADIRSALRKVYYSSCGDVPDGLVPADKKHGDAMLTGLTDPDPFPAWLSDADIDYFVGEFERSGLRGPLNRYRNHRRDWELLSAQPDQVLKQPALFVAGSRDVVLRMVPGRDMLELMQPFYADLRGQHLIEGIGHWTQQEAPETVNRHLLDWLGGL